MRYSLPRKSGEETSGVTKRTLEKLVCRGTDQVRSHQLCPSASVSGDGPTKLGYEGARSEGTKLISIFMKTEVSFTKLKKPMSYEQTEQWMDNEISFPSVPGCQLVDSPIILEALIEGFQVRRIYVDGGSSSELMYEHCFRNLGTKTKARLRESRTPLVGFSGEVNSLMGVINLIVSMGEPRKLRMVIMEFAVVKSHSPYNAILGRTDLRSLGAIASTIHSMIKFPTDNGIATMETKRETLQECRRMEEAQGPILERRITHPRIQASRPEETTIKEKRRNSRTKQ
ncbi:reverse transcriptase domain-containing protein [Tanacetum coccineum]